MVRLSIMTRRVRRKRCWDGTYSPGGGGTMAVSPLGKRSTRFPSGVMPAKRARTDPRMTGWADRCE